MADADVASAIELADVDQWLAGSQAEAKTLLQLAPLERFDAGPLPVVVRPSMTS